MLERFSNVPFRELLPGAEEDASEPARWIAGTGSLQQLIGYIDFVWRDFVLHDGCLLQAGFDANNYDTWLKVTNGNRTAVERVINHVHILDLFLNRDPNPTSAQVILAGRLLRDMWGAKLKRDFPALNIVVDFPDAEAFDDLLDYEISVYQARD